MAKGNRTQTLKRCFGEIYKQGQVIDNARVRHLSITGVQARYLEIVGDHPGINQDEVARILGVDKGTVARAVKKLETEQYIRRKRNKEDIRAWCLFLTERGEEVYYGRIRQSQEFEKKLFEGFREEEIDTLVELMDRLTTNMEAIKRKG